MIFAQIGEEADGIRQWASFGPHRVVSSRRDAGLELARLLVKEGYDLDQPYGTYRGFMPCMMYRSLGDAAGLTVRERDDGKAIPRIVKHEPYTGLDE